MTNSISNTLCGVHVTTVLKHIASEVLGSVGTFTFAHYDMRTSATKRADPAILRFWRDFPWWVNWGGIVQEAEAGDYESVLDRLVAHTPETEFHGLQIVQAESLSSWLETHLPEYPPDGDRMLVVCSRVEKESPSGLNTFHIPMMDFRCGPSERNTDIVVTAMKKLGQKHGAVLRSGRSYHYYGFELLTESEWREFMYRCLLLAPYTDSRYVGHRLLAGTARLRISAGRAKPSVPEVVATLS